MLRAVIVVVVACLVGILLVPHRPAPVETPVLAAVTADSVRVERRLVTVEAVAAEPDRHVAPVIKKARQVKRTDTLPEPFIVRATRLVLGDGRVRPEPFPRVR